MLKEKRKRGEKKKFEKRHQIHEAALKEEEISNQLESMKKEIAQSNIFISQQEQREENLENENELLKLKLEDLKEEAAQLRTKMEHSSIQIHKVIEENDSLKNQLRSQETCIIEERELKSNANLKLQRSFNKIEELEIFNLKLFQKLKDLEQNFGEEKEKSKQLNLYKKTTQELSRLIKILPQNSPCRRPLVNIVCTSVGIPQAANLLQVSSSTAKLSQQEGYKFLLDLKYHPKSKRPKRGFFIKLNARKWLDEKLPIISGRNYAILSKPENTLYQEYLSDQSNPECVSITTFKKLLKERNIWRSTKPSHCPYCKGSRKYGKQANCRSLEHHKRAANLQMRKYVEDRKMLRNSPDTMIIVQDFTKLEYDNVSTQDLIFTVYKGGNQGVFKHYLMEKKDGKEQKNDTSFAVQIWNQYFPEIVDHIKHLIIWSDGGRKHFKNNKNLWWMQKEQNRIQKEKIQQTLKK